MLGEGVVKRVIAGFEDSQPVIEGVEFPFHVGGYGVELDLRELAAGVEVDGAGAAILDCGIAIASSRESRSASAMAWFSVSESSASSSSVSLSGLVRKRETSDQTTSSKCSPLMEAPTHLPENGPRWAMEPLQR